MSTAAYVGSPAMLSATGLFTPSELILLHAEQFAGKGRPMDMVRLLDANEFVSASQLGSAMLTAAIIFNEQAGSIRLELRTGRIPAMTRQGLFATLGPTPADWLPHSLEDHIFRMVQRGPLQVHDLVSRMLHRESNMPWELPVQIAKAGLVARGLATTHKKGFAVSPVEHVYLAESTRLAAGQVPLQPIRDLLAGYAQSRHDFWEMLNEQISRGVYARYPRAEGADD